MSSNEALAAALGYAHDNSAALGDLPPFIGFLISKAAQAIVAEVDTELTTFGLTSRHCGVLLVLARQDGLTQAAIGAMLRIDRTTMVKLVDELEALDLVARHRDPTDRRAYAVALTEAGRAQLPVITQHLVTVERHALAALSLDEMRTLFSLLVKLLDAE